jgi:hypothetical protein
MICLTDCFSHHILGHVIFLSSTASHHAMHCLWCDRTSGRCVLLLVGIWFLSVLLCLAGETFAVRLCLPPSEVKLCFAPLEVYYCLLFRWGDHNFRFSSCGAFENIGQVFQSYCLRVVDLTKWACQLRM